MYWFGTAQRGYIVVFQFKMTSHVIGSILGKPAESVSEIIFCYLIGECHDETSCECQFGLLKA